MESYTLSDAQHHLQKLVDDARKGKTVLIVDEHNQAVQLVPVKLSRKPRQAGSAYGQIKIHSNFDDPLPDFDEYMP